MHCRKTNYWFTQICIKIGGAFISSKTICYCQSSIIIRHDISSWAVIWIWWVVYQLYLYTVLPVPVVRLELVFLRGLLILFHAVFCRGGRVDSQWPNEKRRRTRVYRSMISRAKHCTCTNESLGHEFAKVPLHDCQHASINECGCVGDG